MVSLTEKNLSYGKRISGKPAEKGDKDFFHGRRSTDRDKGIADGRTKLSESVNRGSADSLEKKAKLGDYDLPSLFFVHGSIHSRKSERGGVKTRLLWRHRRRTRHASRQVYPERTGGRRHGVSYALVKLSFGMRREKGTLQGGKGHVMNPAKGQAQGYNSGDNSPTAGNLFPKVKAEKKSRTTTGLFLRKKIKS